MPIGNLTSQWFANWYLNGFDHAVTSGLGFGGYVRHCDDFVIFETTGSSWSICGTAWTNGSRA